MIAIQSANGTADRLLRETSRGFLKTSEIICTLSRINSFADFYGSSLKCFSFHCCDDVLLFSVLASLWRPCPTPRQNQWKVEHRWINSTGHSVARQRHKLRNERVAAGVRDVDRDWSISLHISAALQQPPD